MRSIVFVQRSLVGARYPEQPRNTPVLAVRTCMGLPHLLQGMSVFVGSLARMPPSALPARASFSLNPP